MTIRLRDHRNLATQNPGYLDFVPRTMPVMRRSSMGLGSAAGAAVASPNQHYALTSSSGASRRATGVMDTAAISPPSDDGYGGIDDKDFLMPSSVPLDYPILSTSGCAFPASMAPNMDNFHGELADNFLMNDAFVTGEPVDCNYAATQYAGDMSQYDHYNNAYMSMDSPLYPHGSMRNYPTAIVTPQRMLTPPPEETFQDTMPGQQLYPNQDVRSWIATSSYHPSFPSYLDTRFQRQPRPIRSASERSGGTNYSSTSPISACSPDSLESASIGPREKARSSPWYNVEPKNGKYYCPWTSETNCKHPPTPQRCVYNKYLDSHIKPYRCKIQGNKDCQELRFSSNACLLRHGREAHGDNNHGVNPFLCLFPDCERAKPANGFPRHWNQRDHMKRVHGLEEPEQSDRRRKNASTAGQPKRKKVSTTATSVPMRRSGSSAVSKAHAMGKAVPQAYNYTATSRVQYAAPGVYPMMPQEYTMTQPVSMADVQFTPNMAISRTPLLPQTYPRMY